ncbi:MAG: hypothetical protein V2G47_07695 [bacterium JZ-2024 1]
MKRKKGTSIPGVQKPPGDARSDEIRKKEARGRKNEYPQASKMPMLEKEV